MCVCVCVCVCACCVAIHLLVSAIEFTSDVQCGVCVCACEGLAPVQSHLHHMWK